MLLRAARHAPTLFYVAAGSRIGLVVTWSLLIALFMPSFTALTVSSEFVNIMVNAGLILVVALGQKKVFETKAAQQ